MMGRISKLSLDEPSSESQGAKGPTLDVTRGKEAGPFYGS
jgi:hypothetical protein